MRPVPQHPLRVASAASPFVVVVAAAARIAQPAAAVPTPAVPMPPLLPPLPSEVAPNGEESRVHHYYCAGRQLPYLRGRKRTSAMSAIVPGGACGGGGGTALQMVWWGGLKRMRKRTCWLRHQASRYILQCSSKYLKALAWAGPAVGPGLA